MHEQPPLTPVHGCLIVNADDWGRDSATTDRILECLLQRVLSSASGMVFMCDSERAAELARQHGADVALHLNLTTEFTAPYLSGRLREHHDRVRRFLCSHRYARLIWNPALAASFEYAAKAQIEEFTRLYRAEPARIDGHHHMHLCENVQRQQLLPAGIITRRNFSSGAGEKGGLARWYRSRQDRRLAARHPLADYLFSLPPMEPRSRLEKILDCAERSRVELEAHPANPSEYGFLMRGELQQIAPELLLAQSYRLSANQPSVVPA